MPETCLFCDEAKVINECPKCKSGSLCQIPLHQKFHGDCNPLGLRYDIGGRGRFLVATRDIEAGEVVFREQPFVVVPNKNSTATCVSCFKVFSTSSWSECDKCKMPLCQSEHCRGVQSDHRVECQILSDAMDKMTEEKKAKLLATLKSTDNPSPLYLSLGPMRLLLKLEQSSLDYIQWMSRLMDHKENRKQDRKTWMLNHVFVAGFLRSGCRLERFSDEVIQRAIGVLRTNGVKLETEAVAVGLYPLFSMLNHSCLPNIRAIKKPNEGHLMEVKAIRAIKKGEEILTRYTRPQWSTIRRQQLLQNQWYFTCRCARCLDPTEFGSMMNAVRCSGCLNGHALPVDPIDLDSSWRCLQCSKVQDNVMKMLGSTEAVIEKCKAYSASQNLMDNLTKKKLHPNHFLILRLKEKMIQDQIRSQKLAVDLGQKVQAVQAQIKLLKEIKDIMDLVDPLEKDKRNEALGKLEDELLRFQEALK